ncbi:MAG: hypothetical protein FWE05_11615 [Defluviitaleaceae bacterium]|nr:hypothetical protein [Defluviitaleaceae bacterium]
MKKAIIAISSIMLITITFFFIWNIVITEDENLERIKSVRHPSMVKWGIMEGAGITLFHDEDFDCSYAVTCIPLQESDFIHVNVVTEEELHDVMASMREFLPLVCDDCIYRRAYFHIVIRAYRALATENL